MRNLALGRPVTSSAAPNAGYPNYPVDVIRSGDADWTSAGGHLLTDGSAGVPEDFQVGYIGYDSGTDISFALDLEAAHTGEAVNVFGYYGHAVISRPLQVMLEQSDNGSAWTTVLDLPGLTAGGQPGFRRWLVQFDITAETAHRYWRVTLERQADWMMLSEIEFWG